MASSFWQFYMGDSDWRRRQDIDRALEAEADNFGAMSQRLARLSTHVHELSLTVSALMKVLSEVGQLDPRAIQMRVEAELEAMKPAATQVAGKPGGAMVQCGACGCSVPASQTTITATGTLCDKCAAL